MKIYDLTMENCEHYISGMCKIRTNEFRNCVLPRCCAKCNKRYDDEPCICKRIYQEWEIIKNKEIIQ